jgi:hypothetical protein
MPYTEPLVAVEEVKFRRTFVTDLSITFVSSLAGRKCSSVCLLFAFSNLLDTP